MRSFFTRLINVAGRNEDDRRRRRLLNILIVGLAVICALTAILMLVASPTGNMSQHEVGQAFLAIGSALAGLCVTYALNRWLKRGEWASIVFLAMLIASISMSDDPVQLVGGRSTIFFVMPVLVSSVLLTSWAAFGTAALCGLLFVALVGFDVARVPMAVIELFTMALIAWLSARSLEDTVRQLAVTNQNLEHRVEERTQALAVALDAAQQANLGAEKRAASEREQRERLEHLLLQIQGVANNLSSTSTQILAATAQQASGSSEQSAAISQATATIEEVRAIAEQTAHMAQNVAETARRTADVSQSGQEAVGSTVTGIDEVRRKVETIATNILALAEQAQAIGQIIAAVSDIAAQSNMLALNAAVEAARAGEAGRGFAVVAGEVRALAEQSRAATVQVKEILSQVQRGVNAAVMATEEGMKGADVGITLAGEAGRTIQKLAESIAGSTQAAVHIATAAGQQLAGMEQIATAMENIHQAATQSMAGARQMEQAAAELNGLAGELGGLVERYRL